MAAKSDAETSAAPSASAAGGARPRTAGTVPAQQRPRNSAVSLDGGHRRFRTGKRMPPSPGPEGPPDLAAVAREAAVRFLHESSAATAESECSPAAIATFAVPAAKDAGGEASEILPAAEAARRASLAAASHAAAEAVTWRAANVGVATLDRIESLAAQVQADIAAGLRAQADLQARAGAVTGEAVRAAQAMWLAANTAVAAGRQAKISLRRNQYYVAAAVALLIIAIVIVVVTSVPFH